MYSVASGMGLGEFVPNRRSCSGGGVGYPCFRQDVLRVLLSITDTATFNGPRPGGRTYDPFTAPLNGGDPMNLPPVEMFPHCSMRTTLRAR